MKILYVKNNSERAKKYQLSTIIFEKDGIKYVKKKALCKEAIPHLKNMKKNYDTLTNAIVNPNIKLSKILNESENSLTFEFIEGISLEKKFNDAIQDNENLLNETITNYIEMLKTSFKTIKDIVTESSHSDLTILLNNVDFSEFNDFYYFKGISNIDLIFSNILYKDNLVYLIDYEWVFPTELPLEYNLYRALRATNHHTSINLNNYFTTKQLVLFETIEKNFFDNMVAPKNSFLKMKDQYNQNIVNTYTSIQTLQKQVHHLQINVHELQIQLQKSQEEVITYASSKSWQITRPIRKIFSYFKD